MPKVQASLADVSTKFEPIEPGDYDFVIESVEDKTQNGREAYQVVSTVDEPGTDEHGKKVFDFISLTKRDGTPNNAGMAQLKRYFEAVFGEDTVADPSFDYDTDELVKQRFHAEVVIESWEKDGKSGKSNRFKMVMPVG